MSVFLVERDLPGVEAGAKESKMGQCASPLGALRFDGAQFGQALADFQGVQWLLADMAKDTAAARLLTHAAAIELDGDRRATMEAAMAKCFASDAAVRHTSNAVQIFGGSGYIRGFEVERLYRNAKVTQIYEGTIQIQRNIIARHVLGQ